MAAKGGRVGLPVNCPACPALFDDVDEAWRDHLLAEHPEVFARLRAAGQRSAVRVREAIRVRAEIASGIDQTARLLQERRAGTRA